MRYITGSRNNTFGELKPFLLTREDLPPAVAGGLLALAVLPLFRRREDTPREPGVAA